ncbi:MAG TPA: hypothetical protein VH062_03325 [Polyangiaceae bacterium]|jgi:hypothetical protein|nr:hypothetical protein [Polyangiaceae bacterium]
MTSDPERLLKSSDDDEDAALERELLRSIVDVSPPANAQDDAWDGIAARLAAASAVAAGAAVLGRAGTASTAPATASALKAVPLATGVVHAFATKVVVGAVMAVTATVAAGGLWVEYRHAPVATTRSAATANVTARASVSSPSAAPPASTPETTTGVVENEPAPQGDAVVTSRAEPHGDTVAPSRVEAHGAARASKPHSDDALATESALLTDARASLRSGDAAGALATLRRLDARAPHGVLRQEREVLAIQALAASGDRASAARRAAAFIEAYPNSPHVPSLRRLAGSP